MKSKTRTTHRTLWAMSALLLTGCGGSTNHTSPTLYPLLVGEEKLMVELATTPDARRRGLMGRKCLPEGRGMLFIFPHSEEVAFWMKNTPLALEIAFADETGRIFQIERMEPMSERLHRSRGPVRFALEVPAGWFERHGIGPGTRLLISEVIRGVPVE